MRARTVIINLCLVISLFPCVATSSKQYKRKLTYGQIAAYGVVAAGANMMVSTIIASYYAELVRQTNPSPKKTARDVIELVDAKINQELASRGLGHVSLDELD